MVYSLDIEKNTPLTSSSMEMRKVFSGFKVRSVKLSYSAAQGECVKAQELLITK
jgi:hypothetical protein